MDLRDIVTDMDTAAFMRCLHGPLRLAYRAVKKCTCGAGRGRESASVAVVAGGAGGAGSGCRRR
jgi:hypothetical protein